MKTSSCNSEDDTFLTHCIAAYGQTLLEQEVISLHFPFWSDEKMGYGYVLLLVLNNKHVLKIYSTDIFTNDI